MDINFEELMVSESLRFFGLVSSQKIVCRKLVFLFYLQKQIHRKFLSDLLLILSIENNDGLHFFIYSNFTICENESL